MIVRCVANRGADLPADCLDPASGFSTETLFPLEIGKLYVVYGITTFLGYLWFYVQDEKYTYYPSWRPSPLFDVVDGRLSRFWVFGAHRRDADTRSPLHVAFAFPEWARDPFYYDQLTDGKEHQVALFRWYKALMDLEFPRPDIDLRAEDLGDGWVMCPKCSESWEAAPGFSMVMCPKCGVISHNPRHGDDSGGAPDLDGAAAAR